jgi:hypothetical protein
VIHQQLDIERWIHEFPLGKAREEARQFVEQRRQQDPKEYRNQKAVDDHIALMMPEGEIICSPYDIAVVEQLRREALAGKQVAGIPTDIFLFAKGEAPRRDLTKLGGLPYWPASEPWPRAEDGALLTFIGQISFIDSRDIVNSLPGDILLFFAPSESEWLDPDDSTVEFFWVSEGDNTLITPEMVPQFEFAIPPSYGVIYRTVDYPGQDGLFNQFNGSDNIAVLEGFKIGGAPRWIQDEEDMPGNFLCDFGSLSFGKTQYPFTNVSEPADPRQHHGPMWGDMGSLYVFLDGEETYLTIQCY